MDLAVMSIFTVLHMMQDVQDKTCNLFIVLCPLSVIYLIIPQPCTVVFACSSLSLLGFGRHCRQTFDIVCCI